MLAALVDYLLLVRKFIHLVGDLLYRVLRLANFLVRCGRQVGSANLDVEHFSLGSGGGF